MPIQLNYTDQNTGLNLPASYWFAQYANIDDINNIVMFVLNGYPTIAQKQAAKIPFLTHQIVVTFAQLGLTGSSTLAQFAAAIYTYALSNDLFFTGGTIV